MALYTAAVLALRCGLSAAVPVAATHPASAPTP
eukprot:CAMPEP_0181231876 /NCGR_PEP_ID=MMETSP1096-20121128/35378_1 /TAXON_ID=156174 ORGANISM="Chrysochromulina ericina, Strain CCMP281" /NCGR_SAMPLE_ID=MMETSP1096 /ASSEMBLY_ACC=CAM_ASM_000453 /LENGTH=32 /DNA_ID= /DNA_START= /DNA_END= /DNA_ORIENTATION=